MTFFFRFARIFKHDKMKKRSIFFMLMLPLLWCGAQSPK